MMIICNAKKKIKDKGEVHLYLQYIQILFLVEEAEDRLSLAEENKHADLLTTPRQLCLISTHSEVTHTCPTLLIAPN